MRPKDLKFPFNWQERCPTLHQGLLIVPHLYDQHEQWEFPGWKTYFGRTNGSIFIEYCSGNGDWVIQRAKGTPHENWIAVEKKFQRVRKIWSKMKNYHLQNLLIVYGEALTFTRYYLPENSVDEIYINFPDPWPKFRHAQRRLVQYPFVNELARIVKSGGKSILVTDNTSYRGQIIEEMHQHFSWKSQFPPPFFTVNWENYGTSWFENLWKEKGQNFYYMQFKRI